MWTKPNNHWETEKVGSRMKQSQETCLNYKGGGYPLINELLVDDFGIIEIVNKE